MNKIIGRKQECSILKSCYESEKAELVAVYGRRRVGKTYLVKNYFKDEFAFYITGIYQGSKKEQLTFFNKQLCDYSKVLYPMVDNWFDAFDQLKHYLSTLKKDKIVIFIDELPWLDTPRSRFLKAFELFWNSWASDKSQIKLIVCGSATTWMMSHLLGDKGGLHNRVTRRMKLSPFNLYETEQFLKSQGIVWNRYQIAEAYMILGGTPYYLQMLQKSYSLSQNIDYLFFSENAELKDEYTFLFRSLFNNSAIYRNDVLYQLTDLFTLFYLKFVKNSNGRDEHLWSNMIDSAERRTWCGYSFEQLCLHHIFQIKNRLGISGIQSDVCSWNTASTEEHKGGQIDLLIDRKDQIINLCEMKYSINEFEISKKYDEELRERRELFRSISKTKKALHLTMITTYGLKQNSYSGMIQSEVILDDLFL